MKLVDRIDAARRILASPSLRGLRLTELVNKLGKKQRVWRRQPTTSTMSTSVMVGRTIKKGEAIASGFCTDRKRAVELKQHIDKLSEYLSSDQLIEIDRHVWTVNKALEKRGFEKITSIGEVDKAYKLLNNKKSSEEIAETEAGVANLTERINDLRQIRSQRSLTDDELDEEENIRNQRRKLQGSLEPQEDLDRETKDSIDKLKDMVSSGAKSTSEILRERDQAEDDLGSLFDHDNLFASISRRSGLHYQEAGQAVSELTIDESLRGKENKEVKTDAKASVRDFLEFAGKKTTKNGKPTITILMLDPNSVAYTSREGEINIGKTYGTQDVRDAMFHECAHHIEFNNPGLLKMNVAFIKSRSTDKFMSSYSAKTYRDDKGSIDGTEVLSTGVEFISSRKTAIKLYLHDPEHFHYTIGAIT